ARVEQPDPEMAWSALHKLVLRPTVSSGSQRLVRDLGPGVGKLLVIEGPNMALGIILNEHPVATLAVNLVAAGNHSAVRGPAGPQ
ncbi:unnamed protein product, partial [Polarella glacialis]